MFFKQLKQSINPVRRKILNDPYYRLQNLEEVAIASELGVKIDVNTATIDDWLRLPIFSIHQAKTLVQLTQNGVQFLSIEEIAAALNMTPQRLKPFVPILDFCYTDPDSLLTPQKINPNLATAEDLLGIPLLTQTLVEQIISDRQQYGHYKNLAEFQQRLGLNSQLISQLMYYLKF
jgi:DNA uptake protein ComE-like DNA-binding protein